MKRRELIKTSILTAGLSAINSDIASAEPSFPDLEIKPKQTSIYKISRPMPFDFEQIDDIKKTNLKLKKSKITTLYNSYPAPLCYTFGGEFQTNRGFNDDIKNFDDFAKYVKYAQDKGFRFIYNLNNPKPFFKEDYEVQKKALFELLENLKKIGCNDIKIANDQLLKIISREKFGFNLHVSTSCEYLNLQNYINLVETYPNIKSINLPTDENRNFRLLRNLRKRYPKIEIELLVNEPCIFGCPSRRIHPSTDFCYFNCKSFRDKDCGIPYFFKCNMIYPWWLEYYSAIGINNFKFSLYTRGKGQNLQPISTYFFCIDNGFENISIQEFFTNILWLYGKDYNKDLMLSDIKPYFPDIRYFVKNGYKCLNRCGSECNYCMDCAEKIKKIIL